eukprot:768580-Hanusia_phi.AAC.6
MVRSSERWKKQWHEGIGRFDMLAVVVVHERFARCGESGGAKGGTAGGKLDSTRKGYRSCEHERYASTCVLTRSITAFVEQSKKHERAGEG